MHFSNRQKAYHQRVLQEVALMLHSSSRNTAPVAAPSIETHQWASSKVQELIGKTVNR